MPFHKKTIKNVPIEGRTVLVRADYNVPLASDGTISDDYRIMQSIPTLKYLVERGAKVIVCSHLGRPDGTVKPEFSLESVATHLSKLLDMTVSFAPDCIGDGVRQAAKRLAAGRILLLENVRFHAGEESNSAAFAELLAKDTGAEYFVQDGFGVVHRAHASTDAITKVLPSVSGLLLEREYRVITKAMEHPKRPLVAVLGGAKISDKIKVIERFVAIADQIIIGGAMANTFLKYKGYEVGNSVYEEGLDEVMRRIYHLAEKKLKGERAVEDFILLPTDVVVAPEIDAEARRMVVSITDVRPGEMILDMGSISILTAAARLQRAETVVWNGTLGYAELPQFSYGSARIALQLARQKTTTSIIGGGDTADFVLDWDAQKGGSFTHVSTGGGASLELMAGNKLPGIEALLDA